MTPIKWSHSGLKDFEGCARRFHEVKVLKNYPFQETEHTRYGKLVHEAAELYIRDNTPIPPEYEYMVPIVSRLAQIKGRKLPEYQMGVKIDLSPCKFDDPDVWCRGIADLIIVDDDGLKAWVVDYKTGNDKYPDRDQLVLMSLMVFAHFPHIRQVNSSLLFVVKSTMVKHKMTVDEKDFHWQLYRERVAKLEACHANNVWNPNQTPLCGWCQVKSCEFNPKH